MNTTPSNIGTRIRDARKAAGMSQTVLGQHLNKTLRTIQKYESGEIEPSIATINELAKILHVSSAELMGYKRQEIRLESFADVLEALNELNKKAGIRFNIDVKRPPNAEGWTCSLTFDGSLIMLCQIFAYAPVAARLLQASCRSHPFGSSPRSLLL